MRVLYVDNSPGEMGGSLMSLLQTTKALVAQNDALSSGERLEPYFYFLYPNMLLDDFRKLGPVFVERENYDKLGTPFGLPAAIAGAFRRLPWFLQRGLGETAPCARRVARLAKATKADLVHANCRVGSNEYAILGAKLAGCPVVVHERLIYDLPGLTRAVATAADAVIAVSRLVADNLKRQNVSLKRLEVVYNGMDLEELARFTGGERPKGPLRVGMVGRVTSLKGQHVLVEAARRLVEAGEAVEFHLAGSAPPSEEAYLHAVQEMVKDAGLESRVVFHGNVKKIYEFMEKMDIMAQCSVEPEALGRVILEGMALAKPCIATRGGAAEEICTDGVDGLLVEPGRADLLAEAILRLARDPEAAAAMGARARHTIARRFSLETCALRVRSVYEAVLTQPARRPMVDRVTEFLLQNPLSRRRRERVREDVLPR